MSVSLEPTPPPRSPVPASGSAPSPLGVGVVVWLASELMFFAGLFAAYFTLRGVNERWPPPDVELATARTAVATVVLVASSGAMHVAVNAAKRGDRRRASRWLGVTALMGLVFLSNQAWEYADAPFKIDSHAYGSAFYLMTGFHGLHVVGGLAFMGAVVAAIAGRSRAPATETVEVCAYYWHFVDVVWVAMFLTIYVVR
ncbi:MAG TPA: heme-copper oxidase subunit III [Acidimicrobiales bacterium]|nr:heme-copper oxidase subunit III [Acidimicrobiales bacterium]